MKKYLIKKIKNKLKKIYLEINETKNNTLTFTVKNNFIGKDELIVKNRKTGKRLPLKINNSKATLTWKELLCINEKNNYDIYLKKTILDKQFLKRIPFNKQNKNKTLIDTKNNYIFQSYPTISNNLSFILSEALFYPKLISLKKIDEDIILEGEIIPFDRVKFDKVEIIAKSNKNGRRIFNCQPDHENNKFKCSLKFNNIKEEELDSYWNPYIQLKYNDIIIDKIDLKVNNLSPLINNQEYSLEKLSNNTKINNMDICTHYLINENHELKFEIITEEKYETRTNILRHKDIYEMHKNEKLKDNYVFFESFHGKYNNNPKYLYEKMLEMGYEKKYKFIWASNTEDKIPGNPIVVNQNEDDYYKYLAKSKYRINNTTFPIIDKRKEIIYLQTWHGTPLKRVGSDSRGGVGWRHFNKEVPTWNYLITANTFSTETFKRAFKFRKKILELGYPANDIFYNKDDSFKEDIKNKLNIPKDKKIILYAPTFRDNKKDEEGNIIFELELDLEKFYNNFKEDYILIIKSHSVVSKALNLSEKYEDFIIDFSNYDDIHELYIVSDILITDYSSAFFDYAHSKKPIIFFMPDLKEYTTLRGIYNEIIEELPGPKLVENDDIIKSILSIEEVKEEYKNQYNSFYKKYCEIGNGNSSEKIIKEIFGEVK